MLKTLSVACLSFLMLVSRFEHIVCNGDEEHSIMKPVRHAERVNVNTGYIKYAKETQKGAQEMPVLFRDQQKQLSLTNELLAATDTEGFPYYITEPCLNHTKLFLQALIYGETWALQMIDSMGKPPSGISTGKLTWLGDWEQCIGVQPMAYENLTTKEGPYSAYKTKYCLASFKIDSKTAASLFTRDPAISVGMCFPESCTPWDTAQLAYMLLEMLPVNASSLPFPYMSCQENSIEYSGKAIAVIVICSLFLTVMLAATVYDVLIVFYLNREHNGYVQLPGKVEPKRHQPSNGHLPANGQPHANGHPSATGQPPANGHLPANENGPVVDESSILLSSSYKHNILSHDRNDMAKVKVSEEKPANYEPGVFGKVLLSFSVYSNTKKILSTSQPSGTLTCVNGIRFVSMTWVILGHTYAFGLQLTDNMGQFFMEVVQRFTFQAISNATVAVDTFFVLSGLLVAYLSLKEMDKRQGAKKFNWFMYYFHRFWRLTPPYMLFLMFYVPLFKHFGDGPIWLQNGPEVNECNETWWTNLLYVNNLVKTDKMCMGWSWYLANDMQFYVISPIFLVALYYSRVLGSIVCLAFVTMNLIATGVISKQNNMSANLLTGGNGNENFEKIYIKPWCRIGPYVVGIFAGYVLYKTKCKVRMPKIVNMTCWLLATGLAILVLYGLYREDMTEQLGPNTAALYNATSRTAWGICIAWVIFACATGYGGPVNALLSWPAVIPLSRLTYCAYLVHPVVMYMYYYTRRTLMHWYDLEMVYFYLGHLCLSYGAAFIVSLAFESPMMGLEKVLLGRAKNS